MERRRTNLFAALAAVWSLAVAIGPPALHPCPQHSPVSGAAESHQHGAGTEAGASANQTAPVDTSHSCQCPECACATTGCDVLDSVAARFTIRAQGTGDGSLPQDATISRGLPAHFLPFAIGPPAV